MRIINSIKNIAFSILSQIVIVILGFVSRKVFLDSLGLEYLGVNGLLTNVLSMLSLVEGGIGTSIIYNLYKPLAEGDEPKIIALVQLYKKLYVYIAIIVFGLSLILYPFLGEFMKDGNSISNITIIYFIFVFKNIISYLNAHKWSLINADQKGYVLTFSNLIFQVITTIMKIIVILLTSNYILYLIIELVVYIIQNTVNGYIVNRRYRYINIKEKYKIDKTTQKNIIKNVKALFLHNIGGYCVFGTDNLLISAFVSLKALGLYSNYTLIVNQLSSLISPVLNGIGASVGNLLATEDGDKSYFIFNISYLINFWIYSFCVIFLYNLLEPFITWCFGAGLLLDKFTFIVILVNFYLSGLRSSIGTFKLKAGIFEQDKYISLIEAIINLVTSIILVNIFGLVGIFLGTTISTITTVFWNNPRLTYKYVFKKSVKEYFIKYIYYVFLTLIAGLITTIICNTISGYSFVSLVIRGIICVLIPNLFYIVVFIKTDEFKYLLNIIKPMILKVKLLNCIVKN